MAGHVARMVEGRSAFKILTAKPSGKRSLGRPRCRWKGNTKMDFYINRDQYEELGWFGSG